MTDFNGSDALRLDDPLSDDERMFRDAANEYCRSRLMPHVLEARRQRSSTAIFSPKWASGDYLAPPFRRHMTAPGSIISATVCSRVRSRS